MAFGHLYSKSDGPAPRSMKLLVSKTYSAVLRFENAERRASYLPSCFTRSATI